MRLAFCVLFVALNFALSLKSLEKENEKLSKTNEALLQALRTISAGSEGQTEEQVAGGCYTTSGSCKSGYYKLSGGLKCCPRLSEEEVAGGCYTESGNCKSGYYKLSGGLKCCPRLSEEEVAGGCYTSSGSCKSGYYKLSGGLKCCPRLSEEEVGLYGTYKCVKRNDCIVECQQDDESKTWYKCMKECPKSLCDKDAESESVDPESEEDSGEEAVGRWTCSKDGFEGTVTTDSWCDKRDNVWMHKCSDCKYGYYWYWWHTYCCVKSKSGCQCAYN